MTELFEGTYEIVIPYDGYAFNKNNTLRYEPEHYTEEGKKFTIKVTNCMLNLHECFIGSSDLGVKGTYVTQTGDVECDYFKNNSHIFSVQLTYLVKHHRIAPHFTLVIECENFGRKDKATKRCYDLHSITRV